MHVEETSEDQRRERSLNIQSGKPEMAAITLIVWKKRSALRRQTQKKQFPRGPRALLYTRLEVLGSIALRQTEPLSHEFFR